MSDSMKAKDILFVVVFSVLVFFGAFFVFSSLKKKEVHQEKYSIEDLEQRMNQRINKRMQKIQTQRKIFKSKAVQSSEDTQALIDSENLGEVDESKFKIDLFKSHAPDHIEKRPESASEKIMALLDAEDANEESREELIQRYKEELIEKARQQGWSIEINDDLEVTSAKRL